MSEPQESYTLGRAIELLERRDGLRELVKSGRGSADEWYWTIIHEIDEYFCALVKVQGLPDFDNPTADDTCFVPDPTNETERLVVLCGATSYEDLTARDFAQLRTRVCAARRCTMDEADRMTLAEVADILESSRTDGEPEMPWENQGWNEPDSPQVRRILRFMWEREQVRCDEFEAAIWGKGVKSGTINTALSRTNEYLMQYQCPRQLTKVRDEELIRFE